MKHLILFLCLTGTANADWEYVRGTDNTDFFFDVQTVRPTKHGVRYWSMSSNRTPEVFWNTTVGSTTTLVEYDCSDDRFRFLQTVLHYGPNGGGSIITTQTTPTAWMYAAPGSAAIVEGSIACKHKI